MKRTLFIAIALLLSATLSSQAQQINIQNEPYIEVRGSANATVEPNKIDVAISLSEAPSKGKITLKHQEDALAKALKAADIDVKKQLKVVSQSSVGEKRKTIYQFKNYLLTLSSAEQLADVFSAFDEFGVANASVQKTYNDSMEMIRQNLRIEAMKNAQQTATTLTEAVGQTIGSAIQINDYSSDAPVANYTLARTQSKLLGDSQEAVELPQDLSLKPIQITQTITVRFQLLPKK